MKRFFAWICVCAVIALNCGCAVKQETLWQHTDIAMGTIIQQYIYTSDETVARETFLQIMEAVNSLEEEMLSRRKESSEVAKLNAMAGTGQALELSSQLTDILGQCMSVWEKSEGTFDVTIGSVIRLWNIDSWAAGEQEGDFKLPETSLLTEALAHSGTDKIAEQYKKDKSTLTGNNVPENGIMTLSLPAGMQLDLGAVGKGIALSEIHEILKAQSEISAAVISAGGSILVYGNKPDGSNWNVGIVNPLDTSKSIATLSLESGWYVATSGDTERYVEVDGVRYHHILDPSNGYPVNNGVRSVTIITRDGLLSDALSTACFVLGVEEGLKLAESFEAKALFVLEGGEMVMSEGMPVLR